MTPQPLIDITDEHGTPTGQRTTIDDANNKGLWHRTAHVVIYTPDKQVLVQKRSDSIIRYPGFLDMSLGGVMHAGEAPEQTLQRRASEELGLTIDPDQLKFISSTKYNHPVPSYGKHVRVILMNYILEIPTTKVTLRYLETEVSWAGFIDWDLADTLTTKGTVKNLGKLIPRYAYYQQLLTAARTSSEETKHSLQK
ncbi:MAG: NUDIX domain-containing protein [Candidatus Saccharibacteria bacterium]